MYAMTIVRSTKEMMKMMLKFMLIRILLKYSNTGPPHHEEVPERR